MGPLSKWCILHGVQELAQTPEAIVEVHERGLENTIHPIRMGQSCHYLDSEGTSVSSETLLC